MYRAATRRGPVDHSPAIPASSYAASMSRASALSPGTGSPAAMSLSSGTYRPAGA